MAALPVKREVTCYVVRDERLLVFTHSGEPWDEYGLQVPSGTDPARQGHALSCGHGALLGLI